MGLVVGDALGVPVEFTERAELKKYPVQGMEGFGTYDYPAGTWSDDSSLTLCLADSLCNGYDLQDIMQKFADWMIKDEYTPHGETFDVGNSTCAAILRFLNGTTPSRCGGKDEFDNGNGALTRILPIALYQMRIKQMEDGSNLSEILSPIHTVCALTHGHYRCMIACGFYYLILYESLTHKERLPIENVRIALKKGFEYYENEIEFKLDINYYHRIKTYDQFIMSEEDSILGSGYVVDSLEAAIWCFVNTDTYADCVLKAVNLGDDTDTTAAIVGGLAGGYYGYNNIPQEWLVTIARREWIEEICQNLYQRTECVKQIDG